MNLVGQAKEGEEKMQLLHEVKFDPCAEEQCGFFGKLFFRYASAIISKGVKLSKANQYLTLDDLYDCEQKQHPKAIQEIIEGQMKQEETDDVEKYLTRRLFTATMSVIIGKKLRLQAFLSIFGSVLQFAGPMCLKYILEYLEDENEATENGYIYATIILVCLFLRVIFFQNAVKMGFDLQQTTQSGFSGLVMNKILNLSSSSKKYFETGKIMNLCTVDQQMIFYAALLSSQLFAAPIMVIVSIVLICIELPYWGLLTPVFFIISFAIQGKFNTIIFNLRNSIMHWKDKRAKAVFEYFTGIRIIKYYAWEKAIEKQILDIRKEESNFILKNSYVRTIIDSLSNVTPLMISILVIICYVAAGNDLSPSKAYAVLTLFNLLMHPVKMLLFSIIVFIQSSASQKRMDHFLNAEERKPDVLENTNQIPHGTIKIEDGEFAWESLSALRHFQIREKYEAKMRRLKGDKLKQFEEKMQKEVELLESKNLTILKNINFTAKKGDLIGIIGTVGSGKSSFLHALLGELQKIRGVVQKNGSIAYVSQQSWMQNATLRDNILFGNPYDKKKYENTVKVCELLPDLAALPGGDQTEIGERGVNLSGGQKQRLAIARAVYAEADIYIIDDCLSALDAHVGKNIFTNVLQGILKDKTVVFVTHALQYMPLTSQIVIMEKGEIVETGEYSKLSADSNSKFSQISVQIKKEGHEEDAVQEEDEEYEDGESYHSGEEIKQEGQYQESKHYNDENDIPYEYLQQDKIVETNQKIIDIIRKQPNQEDEENYSRHSKQSSRHSKRPPVQQQQDETKSEKSHHSHSQQPHLRKRTSSKQSTQSKQDAKEKKKMIQGAMVQEEERAVGSVSFQVYKNYMSSGGKCTFRLVVFFLIAAQLIRVGCDWWLGAWADETFDISTFWYVFIYAISGILVTVFFILRGIIFCHFAMECADSYSNRLIDKLLHTPMWWFDITPTGRIISRATKDQDDIDNNLPFSLQNAIVLVLTLLCALLLICLVLPIFIIFAIIAIFITVKFINEYLISVREIKRIESITKSPVLSTIQETSNGIYIIRAFDKQQFFLNQYIKNQHKFIVTLTNFNNTQIWIQTRTELLSLLLISVTCYLAVLARNFNYIDSSATMGLAISQAFQITTILSFCFKMVADAEAQMNSLVRILQYIENNPTERDWDQPEPEMGDQWPVNGGISVENITYKYRPNLPEVIKGIDFEIKPQEKVGIVGRTGSGKSTLTLGFLRILELTENKNNEVGTIKIDGQDISQIGLHTLRQKCTIIPQDPLLFTGTVKFNIDPYGKFTREEMVRALKSVNMWEQLSDVYKKTEDKKKEEELKKKQQELQKQQSIQQLQQPKKSDDQSDAYKQVISVATIQTQQHDAQVIQMSEEAFNETEKQSIEEEDKLLNTPVDDGGENFSMGQRQLICIARALIKKPKVLLMDEATASIDEKTDQMIQKMIKNVFKDTTVVTIAHRINTIVQYDKLVVLEQGNVVEIDSPLNLMMKNEGLFASLVNEAGEEFRKKMIYLAENKQVNLDEV